jgi:hypothetical protein
MVLSKVAPEEHAAAFLGLGVVGKQSKPAFALIAKGLELRHQVAHADFEAVGQHRDFDGMSLLLLYICLFRPMSV